MTEPAIAVIGGGIAGASVAFHLADRTDRSIVVYERDALASETTARSAAMFGGYGTDAERRLKRYGMAQYNEFLADPRADDRHELIGRFLVATTEAGAEEVADRVAGAPPDDPVAFHGPESLHGSAFLPELDVDAVTGASYRSGVGTFRPRALAREFASRAADLGVRFETDTAVVGVDVESGSLGALHLEGEDDDRTVQPEAAVCAAGPWNPTVAGLAGLDLPVRHSLAPILEFERRAPAVHTLPNVTHVESGVYAMGRGRNGVLVGHHPTEEPSGTLDPGAVEDRVPADLRETMTEAAETLLPSLADATLVDEWVGVRSHTPDGNPIVGWTGVEGLSLVAFDSSGVQLAPAAGDVVARQLVEGDPTEHHENLSIARFEGFAERRFEV